MNLPDDDIETLDRLLGPDLAVLLDALDAVERDLDALPVRDASSRDRRAELEGRRERLRTDALDELVLVRRRLEHGALPVRDERTMPLPFTDLGGR